MFDLDPVLFQNTLVWEQKDKYSQTIYKSPAEQRGVRIL
jgi:hypothetical protein